MVLRNLNNDYDRKGANIYIYIKSKIIPGSKINLKN